MIATIDSASMAPYPTMRVSVSRRDQLGRGAARDQGMKSADGAAGDGDEGERKNISREHRAGAVNEASERRHVQGGTEGNDAEREQRDRPQLHKRAQVVARSEQQPDRKQRKPQIRK